MRTGRGSVVIVGLLIAMTGAFVAPAMASATPAATARSTTNAGYSFGVTEISSVTATFRVPALTCTSTDQGIGPYASLENSADQTSYPWLLAECVNDTPVYLGNLNLAGNNSVLGNPVAAGDIIHLSVSMSATATKVTFADATAGVSASETGRGATATFGFVGIGPIYDSSSTLEGVPTFGRLAITKVKVAGQSLAGTTPVKYNRVAAGGVEQVSTGSIPTAGTSFTLTFKHS
jgi:hypothetical protein